MMTLKAIALFILVVLPTLPGCRSSSDIRFIHHFIERDAGYDGWGCTNLADLDGDGDLDFVTGGKGGGFLHWYEFADGAFKKRVISNDLNVQVGGTVFFDESGRPNIICGQWPEENKPGTLWRFTPGLNLHSEWNLTQFSSEPHTDPHDIILADPDGDGRDEIIVRDKSLRLSWYDIPSNPESRTVGRVIVENLPGDGTAAADIDGDGNVDIVTGSHWFENMDSGGLVWESHRFMAESLDWDPETRVVVADVNGDGPVEIVVTESERKDRARLAVFSRNDRRGVGLWETEIVISEEMNYHALHSLEIADFDQDGDLDIFTAEMENNKTDGIESKPRWVILENMAGSWNLQIILDSNLGTHEAKVGDVDGDGHPDIVGKLWRANKVNGAGGRLHVDYLENGTGR